MFPSFPAQVIASAVTLVLVLHLILLSVSYLILLERKIASWVQNRIGPNRTNLSFGILPIRHHCWGLGQPLADGIKLFLKEDYTPPHVDRKLFLLAPVVAVIPAMIGWAVIPWGGVMRAGSELVQVAAAPISVGVVYILAVGALAVYGVVLAGFASNNKYAFFGGLRATAQMVSYEIPLGLSVLIIILLSGSLRADVILHLQANGVWNVLYMPLLAIIFFTCSLAECNRAPFDLAECEQELVGGFHTEYSSMKWALFFLGEYMHMITGAAFLALLFLGGWDLPLVREPLVGGIGWVLLKCGVFAFKVFLILSLMMLVRWTLPRFRMDQLMRLAWRGLIPATLALLLLAALVETVGWSKWMLTAGNVVIFAGLMVVGPLIPAGPPVNRRIPLRGSRFSPVVES